MTDLKARTNALVEYHSEISRVMTAERTSLESGLIPVTAYILVSAAEAWHRWPAILETIDRAVPAEELGAAGRRPGSRINPVHLWSLANIYLTGRKFLTAFGMAEDRPEPTHTVLDFWERAALAYRGDGHRQAWDAGFSIRPHTEAVVAAIQDGAVPIDSDQRAVIKRFNATLTSYLFLLYFDTRVGTGDTGPYALPDGRTLLVRDWYQLGPSDFWWSGVGAGIPYQNLTAGLVLENTSVKINDWGTSVTDPEDYLDNLAGFGLFTTDGSDDGTLRPVPLDELDGIMLAVRKAQAQHYRNIAAMDRHEKIRCGAYVYFTFIRPFAVEAGVADAVDWTVPQASAGSLYDMLSQIDGGSAAQGDAVADPGPYYAPIP